MLTETAIPLIGSNSSYQTPVSDKRLQYWLDPIALRTAIAQSLWDPCCHCKFCTAYLCANSGMYWTDYMRFGTLSCMDSAADIFNRQKYDKLKISTSH
jgi:hypothetical protein